MFTDISPTYDLLNHLLSLNIDKRWRRALARQTVSPSVGHILDVCGGTGDLALALAEEAHSQNIEPQIICSDFTPAMTAIADQKFASSKLGGKLRPMVADTTALPFPPESFDLVVVGFGIRNVVDPVAGLMEMSRVCRRGGTVAVLEFSRTRNPLINGCFNFYFSRILPFIGRIVTGTRAYSYLSKSVASFPEGANFCNMMSHATGAPTLATKLSFGIATLYISQKQQ